jgi:hypothetical protein
MTHGKVIRKDMPIVETETKMYHVDARDHGHACEKGKKYGRVLSAHKVKIDSIVDAQAHYIEHLKLNQEPIYQNAVAMDDFIWLKKAKRSERIETNNKKDH